MLNQHDRLARWVNFFNSLFKMHYWRFKSQKNNLSKHIGYEIKSHFCGWVRHIREVVFLLPVCKDAFSWFLLQQGSAGTTKSGYKQSDFQPIPSESVNIYSMGGPVSTQLPWQEDFSINFFTKELGKKILLWTMLVSSWMMALVGYSHSSDCLK